MSTYYQTLQKKSVIEDLPHISFQSIPLIGQRK